LPGSDWACEADSMLSPLSSRPILPRDGAPAYRRLPMIFVVHLLHVDATRSDHAGVRGRQCGEGYKPEWIPGSKPLYWA
jgi:hypothetical protein